MNKLLMKVDTKQPRLDAPFNGDLTSFRQRFFSILENCSEDETGFLEKAQALQSLAQSYMMEGKLEEAKADLYNSIKAYEKTSDLFGLVFCISQYALILRQLSEIEQAESMLVKVVRLSNKLSIKKKEAKDWFLKPYFLNLLIIFDEKSEALNLRQLLEKEWVNNKIP